MYRKKGIYSDDCKAQVVTFSGQSTFLEAPIELLRQEDVKPMSTTWDEHSQLLGFSCMALNEWQQCLIGDHHSILSMAAILTHS